MKQAAGQLDGDTGERLVNAGVELALDRGLSALTARALAERTGLSPSALNYHLGGREALIGRVLDHALAASADWRRRLREQVSDEDGFPGWASPASVLAGAMGARVSEFRPWALLLAEFESHAESQPSLRQAVGDEVAATVEFWRAIAAGLGQPQGALAVWADLALGLTQLFLGEEPAVSKAPWIVDAVARTETRMLRRPVTPATGRGAGAIERLDARSPSDGARRLLDAALAVIAEKGAERLTQREVAATAGLSLAATTYFYRTKADLIAAAFHELHRQVSAEALAASAPGEGLLRATLEEDGERPAWRVRAMEALQLASARDPSLAPTARELRATRGATSLRWLRSRGLEVDRLDAFIVSTTMGGIMQRTRFSTPGQRRAALAEGEARVLVELFG